MRPSLLRFVVALVLVPACSAAPPPPLDDATEAISATDWGYFVVRPDLRKCAAPMCGGFFVERPNLARTTCFDGTRKHECYVAAIDWSATQFSDAERAKLAATPVVLLGQFVDGNYTAGRFANLAVSSVYAPAVAPLVDDGYPVFDSTLFRAYDSGIRCITWPCPTLRQDTLNTTRSRAIDGVDLSWTCANERQIGEAYQWLGTHDGILVDGDDVWTGATMPELVAWNFWLPVTPAPPAAE